MHGVHEKVREVVPQGQAVVDDVGVGLQFAAHTDHGVILAGDAAALRVAAVRGVQRAEAVDEPLRDRALRLIRRGIPGVMVEHARDRVAVAAVRVGLAVAQQRAQLALIVGAYPGPVVMLEVESAHEAAFAERVGARGQYAVVPFGARAAPAHENFVRNRMRELDVGRADRGKIPFGRVVRALRIVDTAHGLGDQEVQVRVALTVRVRGLVNGHVGDVEREIVAVVEVVAAHHVLRGLAFAAVDGRHHAGDRLDELCGAIGRQQVHFGLGDDALAGRGRRAHEPQTLADDRDFFERLAAGGVVRGGLRLIGSGGLIGLVNRVLLRERRPSQDSEHGSRDRYDCWTASN